MLIVTMTVALTGCESSDPETEQKLEGTWTYSSTEEEDGVKMTITAVERYSLSDHRFEATIMFDLGFPINEWMAKIKYSGEWSASKDAIMNKVDKGSITFDFNKSLLDSSDRRELKNNILDELKKNDYVEGVRILSPIGDTFDVVDDDGEKVTYIRLSDAETEGGLSEEVAIDKKEVSGDFDGDGKVDHVWINGEFDDEDIATTPLTLGSDNPKLDGLSWNVPCGVLLFNLGKMDDSKKDFLGVIPFAMSDWASYEVYRFKDGSWKKVIAPFNVYLESDLSNRVTRSKIPGYVTVYENNPASDDIFTLSRSEVRLNY